MVFSTLGHFKLGRFSLHKEFEQKQQIRWWCVATQEERVIHLEQQLQQLRENVNQASGLMDMMDGNGRNGFFLGILHTVFVDMLWLYIISMQLRGLTSDSSSNGSTPFLNWQLVFKSMWIGIWFWVYMDLSCIDLDLLYVEYGLRSILIDVGFWCPKCITTSFQLLH